MIAPEWWKTYFLELYGNLYRGPLAADRDTALEAETLERIFDQADGPVLDAGCGFGRAMKPLRAAGIDVVGADYSSTLLAMAPKPLRKRLVQADLRDLPFRDASFAGAALLFNTFGYFVEEADNVRTLREIARVLRPGAPFVMDIPCRPGMADAVAATPASIRQSRGTRIAESWHINEETNRLEGGAVWEHKGQSQELELSIRLYTPGEIRTLLKEAGFAASIQILPFEDFAQLGTAARGPRSDSGTWREHACMAILAQRNSR